MNIKNIVLSVVALTTMLLAVVSQAQVYFVHNDHLGAQKLTNSEKEVVWQAKRKPFGETEAVVETVTFNHRFPGQYFDKESGLYQNYFRDYDPGLGRYIQSDPISLAGGVNTYVYTAGNPLTYIDPNGLAYSPMGEHGMSREDAMSTGGKTCKSDKEIDAIANALTGAIMGSPKGVSGILGGAAMGLVLSQAPSGTAAQNNARDAIIDSASNPKGTSVTLAKAAGSTGLDAIVPEGNPTGRDAAIGAIVGGAAAGPAGYGMGATAPWLKEAIKNHLTNENRKNCECTD